MKKNKNQEKSIPSLIEFKNRARNWQNIFSSRGYNLKYHHSLNAIVRCHGFPDWDRAKKLIIKDSRLHSPFPKENIERLYNITSQIINKHRDKTISPSDLTDLITSDQNRIKNLMYIMYWMNNVKDLKKLVKTNEIYVNHLKKSKPDDDFSFINIDDADEFYFTRCISHD